MQGRFKRDGSAAAEQEPHGGTDRGSSPQHAQNPGPAAAGDNSERAPRSAGPASSSGADPITPLVPRGAVNTGSRIALRNWRISTRLISLLALPVVAATTLGGLRINDSMNDIQQLDHMQLLTQMTKQATTLAQALQEERDRSAGPLSNGVKADDYKVAEPRKRTDRAKAAFFDATTAIGNTDGDEALEGIHASVGQIAGQLGQIRDIRREAYAKGSPSLQTVDAYSQLITSLLSLSQDMAQATSNPEMIKRTRALAAFSSAKEYASVQRAIIAAALPGGGGQKGSHLDQNDRQFGRAALHKETLALKSFNVTYTASGQNAEELTATLENGNNPEIKAADTYAQKVLDSPTGMAGTAERSYLDWYEQSSTKIQAMKTIEETLLSDMEGKARELRDQSQREAIISGALILLVLGVSLVGAFVVARSMIRSLRRLQDTATRVAQDRLPELVKQLSEADPQDVDTSVESVGVHSRDEIGKVAAAFDDVHREAVRLAAEQALLRGNVNAMFTNLSRRSQGLIQRQLSLISELESREADPDQLSSLFKLDHLATRMRRNGENLLVLAGEEPGRRWTRPVPLVDVLRAAASEVEQYERIELAAVPATEVAGRVVNDLVHLLAELLENATSFSSPQTKVRVTGHALPDGRVLVEIHDTGIGLSPRTSRRSTSGSLRRPPWTSRSRAAWVCSWSAGCPCVTASGSSCGRPTPVARQHWSCSLSMSRTAASSRHRSRPRVSSAPPATAPSPAAAAATGRVSARLPVRSADRSVRAPVRGPHCRRVTAAVPASRRTSRASRISRVSSLSRTSSVSRTPGSRVPGSPAPARRTSGGRSRRVRAAGCPAPSAAAPGSVHRAVRAIPAVRTRASPTCSVRAGRGSTTSPVSPATRAVRPDGRRRSRSRPATTPPTTRAVSSPAARATPAVNCRPSAVPVPNCPVATRSRSARRPPVGAPRTRRCRGATPSTPRAVTRSPSPPASSSGR